MADTDRVTLFAGQRTPDAAGEKTVAPKKLLHPTPVDIDRSLTTAVV